MSFYCARPTRAFGGRALREHRRSSGSIPSTPHPYRNGLHSRLYVRDSQKLPGFPTRFMVALSTSDTPTATLDAGRPTAHAAPLAPQSLPAPIRYPQDTLSTPPSRWLLSK